jgi:antitoxin component YwqK of YwqJK toxin-antitoxin module
MKKRLLVILTFLPSIIFAQLTETFVSDTNFVRYYKKDGLKGDTIYYLTNNRPIGKWVVYFDLAKKSKALEREYFDRNEDVYTETSWYRNRQIRSTRILNSRKDTLIQKDYFRNKKLKHETISVWSQNKHGWGMILENEYFENGQIKQTPIDFSSVAKQHLIVYNENGTKRMEYNWVNGAFVDEFKEFYPNGKIKTFGLYKSDINTDPTQPLQNGGIESGKWKYYNENGKLIKEELYDNGKLISTTEK